MPARLQLLSTPRRVANSRLWVAFSGGCDSTVLLTRLARARTRALHAVHVHHGLQPEAERWVRHCRAVCRDLGVPLKVLRVQVERSGKGLEAAAREARYAALASLLRAGDVLATAHHRDDQAETVLFRALRGTGVVGLGAMRESEAFVGATLWRPLLRCGRHELRDYAERHQLRWIEDPQNADVGLARSFLRQAIVPELGAHFPAATANLARLAEHAQESAELLRELAMLDRGQALCGDALAIDVLRRLSTARRRNLIYQCWRDLGLQPPDHRWYAHLEREVLDARQDATPRLVHGEGEARRYRDRLYLMRLLPEPPRAQVARTWSGRGRLQLAEGCGELHGRVGRRVKLTVRYARGGERLRPAGSTHCRTLKNLCQEAGVPPWVRERMPVVERDDELIAVADRWQTAAAIDLGLELIWNSEIPGARIEAGGGIQ